MEDVKSVGQAGADIIGPGVGVPASPQAFAGDEELRDGPTETGARADAAMTVRERIASCAASVRIPAKNLEIYLIPNFLALDECAELIAIIDANRIPSPVVSDDPIPAYRTSETCYLYPANAIVATIGARLDQLTGIDPVQGELLQGQRYAVGQEFKPHHDFFRTDQLYWREQVAIGGQRTWTAMAFLNEPELGGRTNFPSAGVMIGPKAGNLIVWNNMDESGSPNDLSLHQGQPVELGVKYVLTKWYRERRWGS